MTSFNLYSFATIAEADAKIFNNGRCVKNVSMERPTFKSPRPCFGFIWSHFDMSVRCETKYTVDYDTKIYINRNLAWAIDENRKNFCALTDDEIDIYLRFVSQVAGDKFVIEKSDFEDSKSEKAFKGIIIHLNVKNVPFKHVMVICNMIRYMYEWPEAYNLKQMLAAFKSQMFYEDFGEIFCLYESFMMNTYDQKISNCSLRDPGYIPICTTKELADNLQKMNVQFDACKFMEFKSFNPIMRATTIKEGSSYGLWQLNKQNEYKSDLYIKQDDTLDKDLTEKITKLYKLITMCDCLSA